MNPRSIVVQTPETRTNQLIVLFHGPGAHAGDPVPLALRLAQAFPDCTVVSVSAAM